MRGTLRSRVVSRLTLALFLVFALLSHTIAPADADDADLDPACLPTGDTNGRATPRAAPLKILTSCTKLYCNASAKPGNRENLKFIDDTLATYQARNEAFSKTVDQYQAACRVLVKNFCQACATMDTVHSAVLGIQMKGADIEESAALLKFQEAFVPFSRAVARDENDLACSSQIKFLSNKAIELHSANVLRFANTKCDK
jgi:hypothetical protein